MANWYVDPGLATLIRQWKALHPGAVVGTIGDPDHQSGVSDHNPEEDNSVDAGDFMTGHGVTFDELKGLANTLVKFRDCRIAYLIIGQRIISSTVQPWVWRTYSGDYHGHLHVSRNDKKETDASEWRLTDTQKGYEMTLPLTGYSLPKLTLGDDDNERAGYNYVSRAQTLLNYVVQAKLDVDGVYGPKMKAAVVKLAATGNGNTIGVAEWAQLYGLSKSG